MFPLQYRKCFGNEIINTDFIKNMEEEVNSITIEKSYSEALYEITGDVYQKLVDGKIVNYFTSLRKDAFYGRCHEA